MGVSAFPLRFPCYRGDVPKSDLPFGEYPETRSTDPAVCWQEIAFECIPGVLTGADRIMMEIASDLLAEYREDPAEFTAARLRLMVSCFGKFGMSPSDRCNLGVVPPNPDDFVFSDL
jgi:hypothetical protein